MAGLRSHDHLRSYLSRSPCSEVLYLIDSRLPQASWFSDCTSLDLLTQDYDATKGNRVTLVRGQWEFTRVSGHDGQETLDQPAPSVVSDHESQRLDSDYIICGLFTI